MSKEISEDKFLQAYGALLVATWDDQALQQRFLSSPSDVLREFGLDPGASQVDLVRPWDKPDPKICTPESAVQLWNEGLKTGSITFYYPQEMPEGPEHAELSMSQMESVAGGGGCCCCTPCCCCGTINLN